MRSVGQRVAKVSKDLRGMANKGLTHLEGDSKQEFLDYLQSKRLWGGHPTSSAASDALKGGSLLTGIQMSISGHLS